MKAVTLIGGPIAGDMVETAHPRVMVPFLCDTGVGYATYNVRRISWGKLKYYVGTLEDDKSPVHPVKMLEAACAQKPYTFGRP